eukprot:CAMPEP_0198238688 /NCGR_PEP_ID=MMETSP1446-20131203/4295_1 /TAXON_ID=1461542 ORGANISM="Unidentified sp, Strain CCMP2111" /NCGR_SAMPLE_ID=MMETSP1446 /ASSEMBLY_ACC=CAM_ASM_001112 /LENGTH=103 /DNA_ID=CAMNT_0043921155 /DNA_START=425 /DNA_END=736 /DNA_ORIENTATION=-
MSLRAKTDKALKSCPEPSSNVNMTDVLNSFDGSNSAGSLDRMMYRVMFCPRSLSCMSASMTSRPYNSAAFLLAMAAVSFDRLSAIRFAPNAVSKTASLTAASK